MTRPERHPFAEIGTRLWNSPTFTTWGALLSRTAAVLLLLPLVLVRFPASEVGVWQLTFTLFTIQALFDFGLAPTFSRFISYARTGSFDRIASWGSHEASSAKTSQDPLLSVISAQRWVYRALAVGVGLLFAVGGTLLLQKPVGELNNPDLFWRYWPYLLLCSSLSVWGNGYAAALQGMDEIPLQRRWEILFSLLQTLASLLFLLLGGNIWGLLVTTQTFTALGAIRNRGLFKRKFPHLMASGAAFDSDVLRATWPATWRSGIGVLMSQGLVQLSGVVLSQRVSTQELASYLLALRAITMISQFSQAPFYSKLPKLSALYASGETAAQIVLAKQGIKVSLWVYCMACLGVAAFVPQLLSMLGSKTDFVDPTMWALISAAFLVERYGAMYLQLYSTTNHIVWHIANGATGVAMIVLAVWLVDALGIWGLPIAMLIAYTFIYTSYSIFLSRRKFGIPTIESELKTAVLPVVVALLGGSFVLTFRHLIPFLK